MAADAYTSAAFSPKSDDAGNRVLANMGFGQKGAGSSNFAHAVAFDKSLEWLCWHPAIFPIVLELTGGKPQMNGPGTMIVDDAAHTTPEPSDGNEDSIHWHCAREIGDCEGGAGYDARRAHDAASCTVLDGRVRCNNFVCFPYLDSVSDADGGLVVRNR